MGKTAFGTSREIVRRLRAVDGDALLDFLSEKQHVGPHVPVSEVLAQAGERLGVCPTAAARALAWLDLQGGQAVGRLRRTELIQLAKCLHRFMRSTGCRCRA